ncbi:MAG: universal stress protein [Alphaproteobacteria bacterium]|nr:universal stress protein [Alphaproteobacteria bacterium]
MALKDILVHIDNSPSCPARLDVAINLARENGAHLAGLYVIGLAPIHQYAEADLGPELIEAHDRYMREASKEAEQMFKQRIEGAGLDAEWRSVEGNVSETVALNARYADLAILGQRNVERLDPGTAPEMPEHTVLDVGRPVLLVPHSGEFPAIGKRVFVAWKANRGAARAVNDSLGFLKKAEKILILSVNPRGGISAAGDVPGDDIARHLARHGIDAEAAHVGKEELSVGEMLLSRAAEFGADLLVMGAFGHSRWRSMILGGVTRRILADMTLPVLISR